MHDMIPLAKPLIVNVCCRAMYISNGTLLKAGDWMKNPKLGDTLEAIAKDPEAFYHSELTQDMVDDIKSAGKRA